MKVLLKSLTELKYEYGIEKFEDAYIIFNEVIYHDILNLFGKVVEVEYDKRSDSYVIYDWYIHPNFIKGIVINEETKYTIKRLSDGIEYDFIERID